MNKLPIYFDYMATTPVDPRVIKVMMNYLGPDGIFGNPASISHSYGRMAAEAVLHARQQIADAIGASSSDIIFTSGATEADNLAILGAATFYQRKGKHLITMSTEHKAVLESVQHLEKDGFSATYLRPDHRGLLDLDVLQQAITPETILISVMHVNNEIGVIQDIEAIGQIARKRGVLFHVDAAQSAGKLPIDLATLPVDLMSFSAHKNYGPKGVGALYIRPKPRIRLTPRVFGGGHEKGLRAGTLATHQIVGMGEAFALSEAIRDKEQAHILKLRHCLWDGISTLPGVHLNGDAKKRIAGNLNVTFKGLDGESLLLALHRLALSSTSACTSAIEQPSYVLKAIGLDDEDAYSSLRISLGRFTTEEDVAEAIILICEQVTRLHTIRPLGIRNDL
ncbi:MAG: IscS subfamily cysteine desulfurase [Legionellales bacterium RIFCSPHIGHO2_12_FULL_42_9]|nr:MAG: IscS subfamily cysteine desulfurase [Legionellales bacterium RIFCSPHIGHO2_12_FULL_42_9]